MNHPLDKTRLRISFLMLGASLAGLIVVFAATTILDIWKQREQTPRLAADSLVKALRTYHAQTGRFPPDFRELEARVCKHKRPPDFGADGRSLAVANYYYLYAPVDARQCSIWIIPTGPRRQEGSTHFLLLAPESLRRWKGAPLSLDETKTLPPVPQYREMALLGMTEQQSIDLVRRTK
jgi:hypothetical protein